MTVLGKEKSLPSLKVILSLVVIYIVLGIISNISSLRIVKIFTYSMDAGTIFYPLTFTLRDMIHKKAGSSIAIYTVFTAAIVNVLLFGSFYIVSALPADMDVGLQEEFAKVLLPGIRIVGGSILAMIISELIDTGVYSAVVKKLGDRYQWLRVLVSNAVSVPIDSIIFTSVAFYGIMPSNVMFGILSTNILLKYVITFASVGSIYFVKEKAPVV